MAGRSRRQGRVLSRNRAGDTLTGVNPHNAAYLHSFFSARSLDTANLTWYSERGDMRAVLPAPTSPERLDLNEGTAYLAVAGLTHTYGTGPVIAPTDDALMLAVGKLTVLGVDAAEAPTISYRYADPLNTLRTIKARLYADNGVNPVWYKVADQLGDDLGNTLNGDDGLERHGNNNGDTFAVAAAWDRAAKQWHVYTFNVTTGTVVDDYFIDTTSVSSTVTMPTNEELADFTTGGMTVVGRFYAAGLWVFPSNALPADWKAAARSMGVDWAVKRYRIWDAWGTT